MPKPVDPTNSEFEYRAFQIAGEVAKVKLRGFDDVVRRVKGTPVSVDVKVPDFTWYDQLIQKFQDILVAVGLSDEEVAAYMAEITSMYSELPSTVGLSEEEIDPYMAEVTELDAEYPRWGNSASIIAEIIRNYQPPFEGEIEGISEDDKRILRERLENEQTPGHPGF